MAAVRNFVVTAVNAEPRTIGLLTQITRFVLVGGLSALVDYGTYQGFLALGIWVHGAKAMSFVLGTTTAYLLNRRWTFNNASGGTGSVAKFALLYTVTFFVNIGMNAWMLGVLGDFRGHVTVAWIIAQGVATAINFVILRTVVFKAPV
ncbi:GtrA family protein [Actinocrispum wychmicini]|uniref:Putative flippase GtrA n=1 Tax=Actinocrispum wychmicini TaxID=1213861 RepID=A0A4R2KD87_9PSEU|nr:GtrA family protein [Actinocrispum wychmicini]TCO64475.1 putative flippase GtrA [Actinocrispum wychmicini]